MFNSQKPNKLVNRIHKRFLYEQCLMMQEAYSRKKVKVSVFTITSSPILNYTDVQILNGICPPIVKMLCSFRENKYNLRKAAHK